MRMRQTRVELARRSRLSETKIIRVEDGDPDVDLLQLVAIAKALDIPLRRLLRRAEWKVGGKPKKRREGGASVRRRTSRGLASKKPKKGPGG
jgi:hypothetical protein